MQMDKRLYGIDLIKSIAVLFVIVIHISSQVFSEQASHFELLAGILWESAARAAVPLFFMCSGVLLLYRQKAIPVSRLYSRYIPRIMLAAFIWDFIYKLYHLEANGSLCFENIKKAAADTALFDHEFHLYYLHIMLIVYIILPALKTITDNAAEPLLRYLIFVWFAFAVAYPTLKGCFPLNRLKGIPLQWSINMTYGSAGYLLLGYYLKKYPLNKRLAVLLAAAGFTFTFAGTCTATYLKGALYSGFMEGMSIGVCLYAAGLFALLLRMPEPGKAAAGVISYTARSSFFVYLFHMLLIYTMRERGADVHILPIPFSVPLLSVSVLAISLTVCYAAQRLCYPLRRRLQAKA